MRGIKFRRDFAQDDSAEMFSHILQKKNTKNTFQTEESGFSSNKLFVENHKSTLSTPNTFKKHTCQVTIIYSVKQSYVKQ